MSDAPSYDPQELPDERPGVVREAHDVLESYQLRFIAAGGAGILGWFVAGFFGFGVDAFWLVAFLLLLVLFYFLPLTRAPRLARHVLRRWDEVRVQRALESGGLVDDPRLEVAEAMADRILHHPSVDGRTREATRSMVRSLRVSLNDLRRVEVLFEARSRTGDGGSARSLSDLRDHLDARVTGLLSRIARLHETVVLRDAGGVERVLEDAEDLLRRLEAERDVDAMLEGPDA